MRARRSGTYLVKFAFLLILFGNLGIAARPQDTQSSQEQLKQLSLEQLGDIEVTTKSKAPERIWNTAAAIYVITQDDIRRSGATSIPEALRLAPGVEVARIDSDKWSIGIRGFGSRLSRSVLVLIDGRSVYTTLLAGTYWEVQDTVMEDIDRIEVIRGPGGTVWGPNAVDGVINVITKNSKDTQGTLVALGGGDEEQGFLNTRYGGTNGNGLSYRVYAKGYNRAPEFHLDGDNYDHWKSAQGGFRMDWTKNAQDSFTLQGDLYDERAGEDVTATSYTAPYSQALVGNAVLSGGNIMGRWTRVFGDGSDIQVQAYYDRTNRYEPNFDDIRNTFDIDFLERFHLGSRHHLSWGLGARASHGHEPDVVSGLYFIPDDRTDQLYTGFIEDDVSLTNHLTLEIGTKLLKTNYTGVEPEPSGRLLWTPSETQTVWLAATRAVRTPSDGERDFFLTGYIGTSASTGLPYFARFNANPNFKSEKLEGYELGYRRLVGPNIYLDIAGFFNEYHDLFSEEITGPSYMENTPAPTHLLLPAQFRNGLYGSTTGGEIAPEWRLAGFWRLRGSYSFLRMSLKKSKDSQDVGTAPIIAGSSPQHQVMMQSYFDLPEHVTFDFDYRFVSALPGIAIPSYSTADARLAWTVANRLEISLAGRNLLQPRHLESASDTGPNVAIKRSIYVEFVWRSKEKQ